MTDLEDGRPIYELVHEDDDLYHTIGLFGSLGEAIAAVDAAGVRIVDDYSDSDVLFVEVRRRKIGLCDMGRAIWRRTWRRDWDAEGVDQRWEAKDEQFLI